ncbi:hypothetical protein [Paenibacillus sp. FSL R7-0331]|uniref:hypothetical protein n=1 Tax=Paenibacillus sp. FSL R7-0331 TaxID=1536773 RepID=UPI0030FCBEB8
MRKLLLFMHKIRFKMLVIILACMLTAALSISLIAIKGIFPFDSTRSTQCAPHQRDFSLSFHSLNPKRAPPKGFFPFIPLSQPKTGSTKGIFPVDSTRSTQSGLHQRDFSL